MACACTEGDGLSIGARDGVRVETLGVEVGFIVLKGDNDGLGVETLGFADGFTVGK